MKALIVIILIYGIRGEPPFRKPLSRLNDVITARMKEILKEHTLGQFPTHYINLQRAAELPIPLLDIKIRAYHTFKAIQETDKSLTSIKRKETQNMIYSRNASETHQELARSDNKILELIKRLGISDNFTARVFKAIFSDEKQLKKLKKKLDELGKEDMDSNSNSLWDFIFNVIFKK